MQPLREPLRPSAFLPANLDPAEATAAWYRAQGLDHERRARCGGPDSTSESALAARAFETSLLFLRLAHDPSRA